LLAEAMLAPEGDVRYRAAMVASQLEGKTHLIGILKDTYRSVQSRKAVVDEVPVRYLA